MKNSITILIPLVIILVGCDKKHDCEVHLRNEGVDYHGKMIITYHPNARMDWVTMERSVIIHKDSIPAVSSAIILSNSNHQLIILLEGSCDSRNIESYIYTEGRDSVICLPTNGGFLGLAAEEDALIMQSYAYYDGGGRYSVIEAFDFNGKRVGCMPVKLHPEYDIND